LDYEVNAVSNNASEHDARGAPEQNYCAIPNRSGERTEVFHQHRKPTDVCHKDTAPFVYPLQLGDVRR
jgi:hypothetical protein